jgi:YesN/AraC family two-component response regulator
MMRLVLRNGGAQDVQQAKDGREGLDTVLREHAAGRPFDLVITDIQVKYALVGLG